MSPGRAAALLAVMATAVQPTGALAQQGGREGAPTRDASRQAAWVYEVRDREERFDRPGWEEALPDLDVTGDWQPLQVIQAPSLAWLTAPGEEAGSVRRARLVLHGDAPILPGPGGLLVRGWPQSPEDDDAARLELSRGDRDRTIAGRDALHYRLTAVADQVDTVEVAAREPAPDDRWGWRTEPEPAREPVVLRYRVTADLWILGDLPFSWAPFGADDDALPFLLPAVRDGLEPELRSLGLVGRAVLRYDVTQLRDGMPAGGWARLRGFEIADLRRHDAPAPPDEPVVDRSLLDALDRLALRRPRRVCGDATRGDLPAVVRARVDLSQRGPLLGYLTDRCRRL